MKHIKRLVLTILCLFPALALAEEGQKYLNFTVTNLSNSPVSFKSKDMFDFGKRVGKNETKTITYDFPPKIITLKILHESSEGYDLLTDVSCDVLGWPMLRQMTHIDKGKDIEGVAIYKAGNVHITISDMLGSTIAKKQLSCSLSLS